MGDIDLVAVQHIIEEVAATEIMPRFRNLVKGDIEMKGVNDPVTIADRTSEEALITRLGKQHPGCVFVAEEGCAVNPALVSQFSGDKDVIVIDPLDGTRNFIEGRPAFAVMVALVRRKETIAAWIHDPNSGDTLMGEKGGGVWMRGCKMRLAAHDQGIPMFGIIGSRLRDALLKPEVARAVASLPVLEIGSAVSYDYARLFTGDAQFADSKAPRATFLLYRMSKPWDHIPGLFLHKEAGGYAADLSGKPYDMENGRNGLLVASDNEVWTRLHDIIKPVAGILAATDACDDEFIHPRSMSCGLEAENDHNGAEIGCDTPVFCSSSI